MDQFSIVTYLFEFAFSHAPFSFPDFASIDLDLIQFAGIEFKHDLFFSRICAKFIVVEGLFSQIAKNFKKLPKRKGDESYKRNERIHCSFWREIWISKMNLKNSSNDDSKEKALDIRISLEIWKFQ